MAKAGVVEIEVRPDVSGVAPKLAALGRTLQPLGIRTALLDDLSGDLRRETQQGQRSLDTLNTDRAQREMRDLGQVGDRELSRIGNKVTLTGTQLTALGAGGVYAGGRILAGLKPATDEASALNEVLGTSGVLFGENLGDVEQFAEKAAQALGLSKREALEAVNVFGNYAITAGKAGEESVAFSTELAQVAADLGAAWGTTTTDAIAAIGSALRGEMDPIERYGIFLQEAVLKDEALRQGLIKTKSEALDPQAKILAATNLILEGSAKFSGTFAREADGAAGALKVFNAEQANVKADAGSGLLGVLTGIEKFGTGALKVLDQLPGGVETAGVALAGLGTTSIVGGAATSAAGLFRGLQELRGSAGRLGPDLDAVDGKVSKLGTNVGTIGPVASRSFGALGTAVSVAGGVLAAVGIAETVGAIANELSGLDEASSAAMDLFVANIDGGRTDIINAFDSIAEVADARRSVGDVFKSIGTEFSLAGVTDVRDIEYFQEAFEKISATRPAAEVRKVIQALREQNDQLDHSSVAYIETEKLLDEWARRNGVAAEAQEKQAGATKGQTSALSALGNEVERLGVKIDPLASKWQNFSSVLGGVFDPGLRALDAQEALADGQEAVADAQRKYEDIVNGNTEGLKNATEGLNEARQALNEAVAKTGPGSRAARDAAQEVRDALRAYRELQVEAGKTREGDFFEDYTEDFRAAEDRIREASENLRAIESGDTEEVRSARERLADAQARYNEELANTGPNSEAARDALEEVEDANRRIIPLQIEADQAAAAWREQLEAQPQAIDASIQKVDEWVAKGLVSTAVAEQWKKELWAAANEATRLRDTLPGANAQFAVPQGPTSPQNQLPGRTVDQPRAAASPTVYGPPAPRKHVIGNPDAVRKGLIAWPYIDGLRDGHVQRDQEGREWKFDKGTQSWTAWYHLGGVVPGTGDVDATLQGGEGVVNRAGMAQLGAEGLASLNSGRPANDDIAGLRADFAAFFAWQMRNAGQADATIPILQQQNDLLRRMLDSTASPAAVRAGALEFA